MDWQQKFKAIRSLNPFDTSLMMRDRGDWYLHHGVERKEGGGLSGGLTSGETPEEAITQAWDWFTDPKYYIVVNAYRNNRRAVKWNGFMWEDITEEK